VKGYITAAAAISTSVSSYTIDMSAAKTGTDPAIGDFIFLFLSASAGTSGANTPGPPTGFAELVPWQALGSSTTTSWAVYVKRRVSGETNYSLPFVNTGRSTGVQLRVFWVDGANAADVSQWQLGTIKSRAASGGTTSTQAPSYTTTIADSMAFGLGVERTSASETEANLTVSGTGWTKQQALLGVNASDSTITIASKPMSATGATGDVTFTSINTQASNGAAVQFIIPSAGGVVTPPATVSGQMWNGTALVNGKWYVANGAGGVVPLFFAGMIHPGSPSITAMLAKPVFYCAHRGGSANYPEMSLQGYTQAALRGYDALEVSLARTSDGVWFGLHDASLDRTSLGTGGGTGTTYVASAMTWAQVQAAPANRPATGAPVDSNTRPYARLESILDAYMNTHVIFIDPKAAGGVGANRTELINILKARSGWQERIVAKSVPGSGTSSWLTEARAAGFKTNAMFYSGENFATYHTQADILGMQYDAIQSVWDSIVAIGKPVMAHVCANLTQVTTGTGKGAKGAMVSGIVQVPRVPGL
jgi:hypothetical protein